MKIIKSLQTRVTKFVKQKGGTLPKIFVWLYASIFIACGLLTLVGVIYEFATKGTVNYQSINAFIKEYFAPSVCATFGVVGVLLIDRDKDGIPDEWEKEEKKSPLMSICKLSFTDCTTLKQLFQVYFSKPPKVFSS